MINLPLNFQRDIQGQSTNLIPLVVIDNRLFLSTANLTLNNQTYDPLVDSLGQIKESFAIDSRKFKISNVEIDFFNYEYNNKTLSERFFEGEIMNVKLDVYLKSQSAETLDDCLSVYSGYIRSVEENINSISLTVEDATEQMLDIDLPTDFVPDDIKIPDRYKNERIPFVYGAVDKAPCVYYATHGTTADLGSKYYLVSPDRFFVKNIQFPYIFSDDVYGIIKSNADYFSTVKDSTIYSGAEDDQYRIVGNTILFVKQKEVFAQAENILPDPNTIIGYNFVEVDTNSSLSFNTSTYSLTTQKTDGNEKTIITNVLGFKDEAGTVPYADNDDSIYLMVKDFSSVDGNNEMELEKWIYGNLVEEEEFDKVSGESIINFEASKFFNSSSIATSFDKFDKTQKEISYNLIMSRNITANINQIDSDINAPILFLQGTDSSVEFFNMDSFTEEDIAIGNNYTLNVQNLESEVTLVTKNISHNQIKIGQRKFENPESENPFVLEEQSGEVNWIKMSNLNISRNVILNDFLSRDIYAFVEGRVDTVDGRYTGTKQIVFEELIPSVAQLDESGQPMRVSPVRQPVRQPVKKPVRQLVSATPTKPKTQIKRKSVVRKTSTGGGY